MGICLGISFREKKTTTAMGNLVSPERDSMGFKRLVRLTSETEPRQGWASESSLSGDFRCAILDLLFKL